MSIRVDFDIHGSAPTVHRADRTVWLRIPLSDDGAPALAVFLSSEAAERLLESLRVAVEGRRLVADVENLMIVKKKEHSCG